MDEKTLSFATELSGAWQTQDKEMTWLFDKPDVTKYPHWTCQVKFSLFHNFDTHQFFLERVADIFRLHLFDTWTGSNLYVLKFIDKNNLEIKALIDNKQVSLNLSRVKPDDIMKLFEVVN